MYSTYFKMGEQETPVGEQKTEKRTPREDVRFFSNRKRVEEDKYYARFIVILITRVNNI